MQRIVVDAGIFLAGLIKEGRTRRLLTRPPDNVSLMAPEFLLVELDAKVPAVARRGGVAEELVRSLIADILTQVRIVPVEVLEPELAHATRVCLESAAHRDEKYVATALALDAPIWTFDPDFDRVAKREPRLKIWTTRDVESAGKS